ncbi:oxidoreductase [Candidatus Saccharibacteria bacterium RIFCSPHIGHO2_01_FULL_45_15]|nr:MAG: oxidoreductase [Candidatus Saccharibacteria bacterium RIFCSPHIGHO2_01_FULL_45_15]OGL27684.1 MAG: oxidoreductase [Candidatus Saccharibacteria bacterium RIFCSPHIGHO2_02_FULL_46_12]OGL32064.1 MAG: oxidoreductase [Candidatus Saccharibacteria bacterium RIFCSPHIGHO2_12_FULL_44_22]RYX78320.1 MAG: nucleoside monophosphate kinase [bacterium]
MIVFFGPAGAGKSVQGQMLAARNGWRWLSAGQLLRDTHDIELIKEMQTGKLVNPEKVNELMGEAIKRSKNIDRVILDGFPRQLNQAKWLVESQSHHGRDIKLVVVLEVPKSELLKRLEVRGRADDVPDAIDERLKIYRTEMYPILSFLTEQNVNIVHIDGVGSVGQVHDRIMEELEAHNLAQSL